jgi:hypothetical protein
MNTSVPRHPVAWFEVHVADMQRANIFEDHVLFAGVACAWVKQRERRTTTQSNAMGLHAMK